MASKCPPNRAAFRQEPVQRPHSLLLSLLQSLNEVLLRPEAISTLILDLYPVNRIDSSALHALSDLHRNLKEKQIQLLFSGVKGPVLDAMNRSGLADQVGRDHFYNRIFDASESSKGGQNAYLEAPAS